MFQPLDNIRNYEVILASGSPRRRELLGMLDVDFRVDTSHGVDETVPADIQPKDVSYYLSQLKASAYPLGEGDGKLIIAADTIVLLDDEVLGKPRDENEACAMLGRLSGKTHTVITGVTVRDFSKAISFKAESKVHFAPLSDAEIEYYVRKYKPLDKAGAYGIQEWIGAAGITGIEGSFYNVMGLPIHRLYETLKKF